MTPLDLIAAATAPGLALAFIIYIIDKDNKEPVKLLLKLFFLGALISIPVSLIEIGLAILNPFRGILMLAFEAYIVAGLTEEWFKRKVILKRAYKNPAFDELFDGIIYAVFVALGFATIENVLYVFGYYDVVPNIWISRALISVPGHMLFGITMGYYIALAKYARDAYEEAQFKKHALIYPVLFHGTFNFLLSLEATLFIVLFFVLLIGLWILNIRRLRQLYKLSKIREIESDY